MVRGLQIHLEKLDSPIWMREEVASHERGGREYNDSRVRRFGFMRGLSWGFTGRLNGESIIRNSFSAKSLSCASVIVKASI